MYFIGDVELEGSGEDHTRQAVPFPTRSVTARDTGGGVIGRPISTGLPQELPHMFIKAFVFPLPV